MKKSLTFYTETDSDGEWLHEFGKGDGWTFNTYFPILYVNKEHIKNNNVRDYRKAKNKEEFFKMFKKIKITMEDLAPSI